MRMLGIRKNDLDKTLIYLLKNCEIAMLKAYTEMLEENNNNFSGLSVSLSAAADQDS